MNKSCFSNFMNPQRQRALWLTLLVSGGFQARQICRRPERWARLAPPEGSWFPSARRLGRACPRTAAATGSVSYRRGHKSAACAQRKKKRETNQQKVRLPVKLHSVDENKVAFGGEGGRLRMASRATDYSRFPVPQKLQVCVGQQVECDRITHLQEMRPKRNETHVLITMPSSDKPVWLNCGHVPIHPFTKVLAHVD